MEDINITNVIVTVIASQQHNNTNVFAHLPASSKTSQPKQDHLESTVSLLDIDYHTFYMAQL